MSKTVVRWGLKTDVGMVRRANQDSVMANGSLFVVADGMGGHRGGEVASGITVGHFIGIERVETVEELEQAVVYANEMIVARGAVDTDLGGMGTTVVAIGILPIDEPGAALQICAANVGDSRLYVLEDEKLAQVSVDTAWSTSSCEPVRSRRPKRSTIRSETSSPGRSVLIPRSLSIRGRSRPNRDSAGCSALTA